MDPRARLDIAAGISKLMQEQIGMDVDLTRMLREPLYARDVLLVCQALRETEGPELAAMFFEAPDVDPQDLGSPERERELDRGPASSGFHPSRIFSSIFGPLSTLDGAPPATTPPPARQRAMNWLFRGRRSAP